MSRAETIVRLDPLAHTTHPGQFESKAESDYSENSELARVTALKPSAVQACFLTVN